MAVMGGDRAWVQRLPLRLEPDPGRVLLRPFLPALVVKPVVGGEEASEARLAELTERIETLDEAIVTAELARIAGAFGARHRDLNLLVGRHLASAAQRLERIRSLAPGHRQLLGCYLTQEYALESAALFNPSIVPHPNQEGLATGELRFVLSLRATGEGHISSIGFRSGRIGADGQIQLDGASPLVFQGTIRPLADRDPAGAGDGYRVDYDADSELSQRTLFPVVGRESHGLEDARFVQLLERPANDDLPGFLGTATAYDGRGVSSQLICTSDFRRFSVQALEGRAIVNKGLAFFPRQIGGHWWMLGRQDSQNIHLMASDRLEHWDSSDVLLRPQEPWEFVQLGNCGSPLETPEGWLVLTHGVGAMRQYCIGAALLDLEDPSRVRGRLRHPLLSPAEDERNGYVPNVVYSCGALIHGGRLVLPYAVSDTASRFALVELEPLLQELIASPADGPAINPALRAP